MKPKKIIDLTLEGSTSSFEIKSNPGASVVNHREVVFKDLKRRFNTCLCIIRPASYFFLAPIDPGSGKTSLLADFIKKWKADGFPGGEGVLLCFSTKDEIEAFLDIARLDEEDYSVQVRDKLLAKRGRGFDGADKAQVLLTSHEMIRHHAGDSFEAADQFFYQGKPRRLRVWDEALSIADPVSIRLDSIGELHALLRPHCENFVEELEACIPSTAVAEVGDIVIIPSGLDFPSKGQAEAIFGKEDTRVDLLQKLKMLKGQKLDIGKDRRNGKTLIGFVHELPADFAPVFVLDGSGRLKHSYRLHETYRNNLIRLQSYQHDYCNLTVHLWDKASGKTNMSDAAHCEAIADAAAAKINEDEEEWLVITHKGDGKHNIRKLVRDRIKVDPSRVRFIHWGIHKATNEYNGVKRVMVVSQLLYPHSAYGAAYKAASGQSVSLASKEDLEALRRSEIQNHILQGVARSNVRNADPNGKCGEAQVYIIGPAVTLDSDMLKETFPGCSVVPWEPAPKKLTKQAAKLVDEILHQLSGGVTSVAKKAVAEALSIKSPALSRHLRSGAVRERLKEEGIACERQHFVRV